MRRLLRPMGPEAPVALALLGVGCPGTAPEVGVADSAMVKPTPGARRGVKLSPSKREDVAERDGV